MFFMFFQFICKNKLNEFLVVKFVVFVLNLRIFIKENLKFGFDFFQLSILIRQVQNIFSVLQCNSIVALIISIILSFNQRGFFSHSGFIMGFQTRSQITFQVLQVPVEFFIDFVFEDFFKSFYFLRRPCEFFDAINHSSHFNLDHVFKSIFLRKKNIQEILQCFLRLFVCTWSFIVVFFALHNIIYQLYCLV